MRALLVLPLLLAACAADPEFDPGGSPTLAMARVADARARGEDVPIRGVCFSACALKLSAGPALCVSPTAQIGVHEVRHTPDGVDYEHGTRDELWTGVFEGLLPMCARNLFVSLGGFRGPSLVTVSGAEMLASCPQIRACGSDGPKLSAPAM